MQVNHINRNAIYVMYSSCNGLFFHDNNFRLSLIVDFFSYNSSTKRTVDFGLARGLSGTMEAKHRLGMAAANFAGK